MSTMYLKFWPKNVIKENKTELITRVFLEEHILKDKIDFWGMEAYTAGVNMELFIKGYNNVAKQRDIAVTIKTESCILQYDEGIGDMIDVSRQNMVEIVDVEGNFGAWDKFCELLEVITGDEYQGDYEVF